MVKVIIMRGVSGSGKSTYAHKNYPGATVLSSDDFWMMLNPGQTYQENFDPTRLGEAHGWNLKRYIKWLEACCAACGGTIVIDNTNTTVAEIAPYYAVAQAFGADAEIISLDIDPSVAFDRNTHGIPKNAHDAMVERFYANFDALPKYWKHKVVNL